MIGTWIAGLGTVGAVITSLYLARNSNKVKLKVSIAVGINMDTEESSLIITIANIGNKMATLKFLNWEIDRRGHDRVNFFNKYLLANIPLVILEGEEKDIYLDYNHWLNEMSKSTLKYQAEDLKLVVSTIQDTFKIKIDKDLANRIMKERSNIANKR